MPLDSATQRVLEIINVAAKEIDAGDINSVRKFCEEIHPQWDVPQVDVYKEEWRDIEGPEGKIPVKVYWPSASQDEKELGIMLYFHGGAWCVGSVGICDNFCRFLSEFGQVIVVSVDYRLAPENKFPSAVSDCYAALPWIISNAAELGADIGKIIVAGDSAGGNLAAVVCQEALRNRAPVWKQLLLYPCLAMHKNHGFGSREKFGTDQYGLEDRALIRSLEMYITDQNQRTEARVSPILANSFKGLPETFIILPEHDPLLDEGLQYAAKLKSAGVPATAKIYKGVIHGFVLQAGMVGKGVEALYDCTAFLRN
jgi:acetyl esterase